jgi:hypothetical protein
MPTHYEVAAPVDTSARALLLAPDIQPTFTAEQFAAHGAVLSEAGRRHAGPMALVELQNGDAAPSYIAGTQNFYVVTRYNWSAYYALAVIQLGEVVEAQLLRAGTRWPPMAPAASLAPPGPSDAASAAAAPPQPPAAASAVPPAPEPSTPAPGTTLPPAPEAPASSASSASAP